MKPLRTTTRLFGLATFAAVLTTASAQATDGKLHAQRAAAAAAAAKAASGTAPAATTIAGTEGGGLGIFRDYVEPLLKKNCFECHSHEAKKSKGGLVVDSAGALLKGGDLGAAVVPGNIKASLLFESIQYDNKDLQMPPDGKLSDADIAHVREWIALGAPDPRQSMVAGPVTRSGPDASKLWSVQPLKTTPVPAVKDPAWARSDVDRFLLAAMEAKGLEPSPDAPATALVRRIHYVLTGLPPTVEETASFVAAAAADLDNALSQRIDELMARPQFGERWGRHWLDVARYADVNGTTTPRRFTQAWRYREYVINAFNADKPWVRFAREQIAGDLVPTTTSEEKTEGQIATGYLALSHVLSADRDPEKIKLDTIDEQLDVIGKTFLGIQLGCARCHDHKIDPFPTREYYALAGVLRSTNAPKNSSLKKKKKADDEEEEGNDTGDAAAWLTVAPDVVLHTVTDAHEPRNEPIHLRGEVEMTGEVVPRALPTLIATAKTPPIPANHSGRAELADWLLSDENSLTARVIANRVWHYVFGQGLVRTTDNFGFTGDPPSNPELLDYLARHFREQDHGSFKSFIKELMLTHAWRQDSRVRTAPQSIDPENRLVWRANPRRMDADAIVDSIQFVSGTLDLGPAACTAPKFDAGNQTSTSDLAIPAATLHKRTVYWPVFRKDIPIAMDILSIFDFPPATVPRGTREVTRVPAQSLALLDDPFVIDCARSLSQSLFTNDSAAEDGARVQQLYRRLYARPASPAEEARALKFLETFTRELPAAGPSQSDDASAVAWTRLCHTLIASNEFIVVE